MATGSEKMVQYLEEARATESALVRTLQAHIAVTPRGEYRDLLERHLRETESHRDRVTQRLSELGSGRGVVEAGVGAIQSLVGQMLSASKLPIDLVRGESGEEKLLKNAKDECATEALEIATYRSIESLANHLEDRKTAQLAERIIRDEERMLERLQQLLPELTEAAARAEVVEPSYDPSTTGAADAARGAAARGRERVEAARRRLVDSSREAVDRVTDAARDAVNQIVDAAERGEANFQALTRAAVDSVQRTAKEAEEVVRRTAKEAEAGAEQAASSARETGRTARAGARGARSGARRAARESKRTAKQTRRSASAGASTGNGGQPWARYDDQTVDEINKKLTDADEATARKVRDYERRHKNRSTVVKTAQRKSS